MVTKCALSWTLALLANTACNTPDSNSGNAAASGPGLGGPGTGSGPGQVAPVSPVLGSSGVPAGTSSGIGNIPLPGTSLASSAVPVSGTVNPGSVGGAGSVATVGVGTNSPASVPTGIASAGTGSAGTAVPPVNDSVTRSASTFAFQHYPIETNTDGVWNGPMTPGKQATSTSYDTVILENGYLKVTLLPSYGGRILSLLHKPTNREFLYQNPLGTPYLMQQDIFYYDYLVIMGGIFPSFPEPEHGKYWNQPYRFEVISESKEAITVRMSRQDDKNLSSGVPTKYDVGRTDVLVALDVTLRAGSTSVELNTKLTNTQNKPIAKFEYWTITTLAPGSTPGKTAIPLNTRILALTDKVHLYESSWSWFGNAEERVSGEVFKWNNLSYFKNWVEQGTAFASPEYSANWSGLMNADNNMGILCVSDPTKVKGLKLWTFGKDSLSADLSDSTQWLRPTIEMWHGVTPEFWNRGTMAANEVRQWSDHYFPTLGLKEITASSKYGALYLSSSKAGTDTQLNVSASLTLPNQSVRAVIRLNGSVISEQNVVVATTDATSVSASVASSKAPVGAVLEAEFFQGDASLLSGKITLQ